MPSMNVNIDSEINTYINVNEFIDACNESERREIISYLTEYYIKDFKKAIKTELVVDNFLNDPDARKYIIQDLKEDFSDEL